jgi:2-keto-3-deoxy-L-rhamnonate aldolase RhmA
VIENTRGILAMSASVVVFIFNDALIKLAAESVPSVQAIGVRGLFQSNYEAGYTTRNVPELIEEANRNRWLVIQIETPEAVECAHEIAAVEHVDWLFVGPADLACTLGVPGELLHPKCIAALGRVAAAAGVFVAENLNQDSVKTMSSPILNVGSHVRNVQVHHERVR